MDLLAQIGSEAYLNINIATTSPQESMSPAHYVEQLKLFSTFVRNMNPDQGGPSRYVRGPQALQRVAVGHGTAVVR